jgi:hypothetical protein
MAITAEQEIRKWNGNGWERVEGKAASIAIDPQGKPWRVSPDNDIFKNAP